MRLRKDSIMSEPCAWTPVGGRGYCETTCKTMPWLGGPYDPHFKFCPYCGNPISMPQKGLE